jgi:predicted secreted protein
MGTLLFCLFFLGMAFVANENRTLTEAENGNSIIISDLEKDKTLTVTLKNNGGTPYYWILASNNEEILAFEKEGTHQPESSQMMVGSPYFTDFSFHYTGKKGTSQLQFDLVLFSGEVEMSVSYTVTVE